MPDKPPFRVHIGNVAYDLTEDAVEKFLGHNRVVEILITRHRDTGKAKGCFVEFQNLDDMKTVLEMDGQVLAGRNARIQVAQRRDSLRQDTKRVNGTQKGKTRKNDPNNGRSKTWEPPMPTEESLKARPKLKLKPRTQKTTSDDFPGVVADGKPNPFGGARPTDTASKLAELEIRDLESKTNDDTVDKVPSNVERKSSKSSTGNSKDIKPRAPRIYKEEVVQTKIDKNPFDLLLEEEG